MNCLVVNCSAPRYNLGALRLSNYLRSSGHTVTVSDGDPGLFAVGYDLVALSCIFSWNMPMARDIALRVKAHSDVWCGGPGASFLGKWFNQETGFTVKVGVDERFDKHPGNYDAVFASRGCNVGCPFCIVWQMEGKGFTVNWDFVPAPNLMDSNLSGLPVDFQNHIIQRYLSSGVVLKDAQNGFEPKSFDEATFNRWKPIIKTWRFAFDETKEEDDVYRMTNILKGVRAGRKRVYVLIGNEPMEECHRRIKKVIEWGCEPYAQPLISLTALQRRPIVKFDWTEAELRRMARWVDRFGWRRFDFADFKNV